MVYGDPLFEAPAPVVHARVVQRHRAGGLHEIVDTRNARDPYRGSDWAALYNVADPAARTAIRAAFDTDRSPILQAT